MMANERRDLSDLYPGFAPAKPDHRSFCPLVLRSFRNFSLLIFCSIFFPSSWSASVIQGAELYQRPHETVLFLIVSPPQKR
jgi:hypothetical protein